MDEVRLYFTSGRALRLSRIECISRTARHVAVADGAEARPREIGVFRWSRGVKVVSILFVRLALTTRDARVEARLEGGRGSMAAALDGAISQEPEWLIDMFGLLNRRTPLCRRLFVRSNPGRKRCGPVAVSFSRRLKAENIRIFLNDTPVLNQSVLERILTQLTEQAC